MAGNRFETMREHFGLLWKLKVVRRLLLIAPHASDIISTHLTAARISIMNPGRKQHSEQHS